MSEIVDLAIKQGREMYQLGIKHGAIEKLNEIKAEMENCENKDDAICILEKHIKELKYDNNSIKLLQE